MVKVFFRVILFLVPALVWSVDPPVLPDYQTDKENFLKVVRENLSGQTGHIEVSSNQVAFDLEDGYSYLDGLKARFLLERLWGNPADETTLGVILPPNFNPFGDESSWAATVNYDGSGHITDQDAKDMNFGDMLNQMKQAVADGNQARKDAGYPTAELIGWATVPHYDSDAKKLFWAKELQFSDSPKRTLNSMIRILGREGTFDVNIVAGMADLKAVEAATPSLLKQINFVQGRRYSDYVAGTDHLAEIGVAGLILGGIAAKAGFFKILLVALAASWKFILIGLAAVGAFFVKVFSKRKGKKEEVEPNNEL